MFSFFISSGFKQLWKRFEFFCVIHSQDIVLVISAHSVEKNLTLTTHHPWIISHESFFLGPSCNKIIIKKRIMRRCAKTLNLFSCVKSISHEWAQRKSTISIWRKWIPYLSNIANSAQSFHVFCLLFKQIPCIYLNNFVSRNNNKNKNKTTVILALHYNDYRGN